VEKSEKDQYLKEKSLEELKLENDRLKSQQSFVRDKLNEKHLKMQELKLEIGDYKRQNTDLNDKIKAFEGLQGRLQDIEVGLSEKEKSYSSNMIEMALSERSKEIYVLQRECEDLKIENDEKSEQIINLNNQMKHLKTELQKASKDRQRLEEKFEDLSNKMDDKFSHMMAALGVLKDICNRPAQCEATTPRNPSRFQVGKKTPMVPKPPRTSLARSAKNNNNNRNTYIPKH
jgi:chromosome segregation ATPase